MIGLATQAKMNESLKILLASGWGIYILILSLWIVYEKRSPQATICWLLALAWLPVLGWLIYYFVGPQRIRRHQLMRDNSKQVLATYRDYWQEQLTQALKLYPGLKQTEHGLHIDDDPYNEIVDFADNLAIPHAICRDARRLSLMIYKTTKLPLSIASEFDLLVGGDQAFDAICKAIAVAKHTIHVEYYIFEPDTTGTKFRDLLSEKARSGVKVRLLLDWLGARKITREYMAEFLQAGGELAFFHDGLFRPLRPVLNMRTHRKIVVCDGAIGFTGGINITDEESLRCNANAYHDVHLRFAGPAVYWLEQVFLEDWHYITRQIPQNLCAPVSLGQVAADQARQVQMIVSGPDTPQAPIWRAKLMAINMAKQRVWLTTPYFAPDDPALVALTSAALRGLDVRVMLPQRADHLITTLAARSWYVELLQAGVRIWEYGPRMLHSKTLLVDEQFSFIGTDNFDNRSFRLNFELCVLNYEKSGAMLLEKQFEEDMNTSKEIFMSDREKVSKLQQLPEDFSRLFSPLL